MWRGAVLYLATIALGEETSDSTSATSLLQLDMDISANTPMPGMSPLPHADQTAKVVGLPAQKKTTMPARPPPVDGGATLPESWVWDQLRAIPERAHPPELLESFKKAGRWETYEFMHIPKNAGTAVESAAEVAGIRWGANSQEFSGQKHEMPDGHLCSRWHVPGSRLTSPNPYANAQSVFCVSRHPYNRFVSEYKWRLRLGFMHGGDGGLPECSSEGLNYFLQKQISKVQDGGRWTMDCHFTQQTDFIWDEQTGKAWCTNVLRYDDLPSAFESLMTQWRLPVSLSSATSINLSGPYCPHLDTRNLTAETRGMIASVYAQDFDRLGYDPGTIY